MCTERCLLPRDPGPCQHSMLRWHYSQEEGRCIVFQYGGCGGNRNRFARKKFTNKHFTVLTNVDFFKIMLYCLIVYT